jgi:hypothetical protein
MCLILPKKTLDVLDVISNFQMLNFFRVKWTYVYLVRGCVVGVVGVMAWGTSLFYLQQSLATFVAREMLSPSRVHVRP